MNGHVVTAAQVFDGKNLHRNVTLQVVDDTVTGMHPAAPDATAMEGLVTPGFVDLQVNGGGGVLINTQHDRRALATVLDAHRAHGTVAIMPTVITDAPEVLRSAAVAIGEMAGEPGILGLHIEGPHIAKAKRGTHRAEYIRPLDEITMTIVRDLRNADIPVMMTVAPEAVQPAQIAALADMGAVVALGHSNCEATEAEEAFHAGARAVTHLYNAMSGMDARAPGLVGAAISSDAHVGMICDGIHVDDRMLAIAIRARPQEDRCFLVSDAMPTVGGPAEFALYGQKITLSGGRLINAEGKLAGAHTTLAEGVARLVRHVGVPVEKALRMAVTTPAKLVGEDRLARLIGRRTKDIMVLDPVLRHKGTLADAIGKQRA